MKSLVHWFVLSNPLIKEIILLRAFKSEQTAKEMEGEWMNEPIFVSRKQRGKQRKNRTGLANLKLPFREPSGRKK